MQVATLIHNPGESTTTAIAELTDDLGDLAILITDQVEGSRSLETEIRRCGEAVPPWVRAEVSDGVARLLVRYSTVLDEIDRWLRRASDRPDLELLAELRQARRRLTDEIRTLQAIAAGVAVAADWHSPSINHSVHSTAGRFAGQVTPRHDDYKRDRHPDEWAWEQQWLQEMVDNPHRLPLRALMAASGMAAFTTILTHVMRRAPEGVFVVGESTYHESRQLLHASGRSVIEIPEGDLAAWQRALALAPAAVFVDSLCNAAGMAVTDVAALTRLLADSDAYLVVDNTGLSVGMQPWALRPPPGSRMIVFESLTKFAQLGLDRAAGGVIVTRADEAEHLDELREHLGTNIADVVAHQHPVPRRSLLQRRLERVGRNARVVAEQLCRDSAGLSGAVRISHPSLGSHPGHRVLSDSGFFGGCIAIETTDRDPIAFSREFIEMAMHLAVARSIPICEGTSFGLDTTRLYLTSSTTSHGTPFLRIAAGTEDRLGVDAVAAALGEALVVTA